MLAPTPLALGVGLALAGTAAANFIPTTTSSAGLAQSTGTPLSESVIPHCILYPEDGKFVPRPTAWTLPCGQTAGLLQSADGSVYSAAGAYVHCGANCSAVLVPCPDVDRFQTSLNASVPHCAGPSDSCFVQLNSTQPESALATSFHTHLANSTLSHLFGDSWSVSWSNLTSTLTALVTEQIAAGEYSITLMLNALQPIFNLTRPDFARYCPGLDSCGLDEPFALHAMPGNHSYGVRNRNGVTIFDEVLQLSGFIVVDDFIESQAP